jgi:thiol:disulfide interchange protein DsbA
MKFTVKPSQSFLRQFAGLIDGVKKGTLSEDDIAKAKASMLYRIKIKRAQEISASSQAQSVPVVLINGKYRTSPYMAGSEENLMKIIDMLTRKEKK